MKNLINSLIIVSMLGIGGCYATLETPGVGVVVGEPSVVVEPEVGVVIDGGWRYQGGGWFVHHDGRRFHRDFRRR